MLKSYFVIAVRNLKKNRLYSAINAIGLALGIAGCLIIFVLIRFETSFDAYHRKAGRIYRVNLTQKTAEGQQFNGCNYAPLAEAIRRDVTGLEQVTGVYCLQVYQFSRDHEVYEDKYAFFADSHYFKVFDGIWLAGNQAQALTQPNTAVVTDSFAEKFLGGLDKALGSTFILENRLPLTVTGIVQTPPPNTDHPYSLLISYASLARFRPQTVNNWKTVESGATYVVFTPHTQPGSIQDQLNRLIQKQLNEAVAQRTAFYLMPLNDNHDRNYDYTSFTYDFPVPLLVILSILAGLIALIACINFVNLATAQALKRAREVGLRKTLGSSRFQLILQHLSEAFVVTLLGVGLGLVVAKLGLLQLNELYGGSYLHFHFWDEPSTLLLMGGLTVMISLLAGFYPAFVLAGYQPVLALKSQTYTGQSKGLFLRRGLVIAQFAGAQLLVIVTLILINQVRYFKDRPLPFNPKAIVLIPALRGNEEQQHDRLRQELQRIPGVIRFSFGNVGNEAGTFYADPKLKHSTLISYVDTAYLATFGMRLLAGRNVTADSTSRPAPVVVNQALIKRLGFKEPVSALGRTYTLEGQIVVIRGVMEDTYTQPMSNQVEPITLLYNPARFTGVALHISSAQTSTTLARMERAWQRVYPHYLCKYQFMDDSLNREYGPYRLIFSILGIASFLALFIGCLGLYGLVSFMALQRTKEIGIRRVFGASVATIMLLFSRESAGLLLVAFVLAAPLGYFLGIALLMEFPERVTPGPGIFGASFLGSLLIALLTIGYRSYQAAVQNPVKSLRIDG